MTVAAAAAAVVRGRFALGDLEAVAAAARAGGVRVLDLEARLLKRFDEIDGGSLEIRGARRVDDDADSRPVVLGLIADISDESPADKNRVLHALSQWAQDRYQPSVAAATFYDLMSEAEEEVS